MAKSEQAGLLEKHVEKLVLALAAVGLVFVLFTWVFRSPFSFKGMSGTPVPAEKIPEELLRLAETKQRQIENRKINITTMPAYTKLVPQIMQEAVSGNVGSTVPWSYATVLPPLDKRVSINNDPVPPMPPLPPLESTVASIRQETIRKTLSASDMGVGAGVRAEDVYTAHVTSLLNYGTMVRPWLVVQKKFGVKIAVVFLDVTAERQEQLADGTWSDPVPVQITRAPANNRNGELPPLDPYDAGHMLDTGSRLLYVDQIKQKYGNTPTQLDVLEPESYQVFWSEVHNWGTWKHHLPHTKVNDTPKTDLGADETPPGPGKLGSTTAAVMGMGMLPTTISPVSAGGPEGFFGRLPAGTGPGGTGAGPGGMGPMGRGMGMGGHAKPSSPATTGNANEQAEKIALEKAQKQLASGDLDGAITTLRGALRIMPGNSEAEALLQEAEQRKFQSNLPPITKVPALVQQCGDGLVQIWVHDITCQQGKTYRYRLQMKLLNPLFGQGDTLRMSNPADAERPVLITAGDWSAPVTAAPETAFFVASGLKENQEARFEVFRQRLGQWRMEQTTLRCGDAIGSVENKKLFEPAQEGQIVEKDFDFCTGYVLVDCDFDYPSPGSGANGSTLAVTLMGPDGSLVMRDVVHDNTKQHKDYRDRALRDEEAMKPPAPPPGTATPGAPAAPGMPRAPRTTPAPAPPRPQPPVPARPMVPGQR